MDYSKDSLNISNFVEERLEDIKYIETAINNSRKKSMSFQRLKYYQRRRSRSYVKKRNNTRRKDIHVLRTHIWYSKRFRMMKIFNCHLPLVRNIKSSKYIYKSLNRGFVFDQSYKQTRLFMKNNTHPLQSQCTDGYLVKKKIRNEEIEVGTYGMYLVVFYIKEVIDESILDGLEYVSDIDCSFLVLNVPDGFEMNTNGTDLFYLKHDQRSGVLFVSKCKAMNTWMWLIKQSIVPVSIQELERIALETGTMNYPFDCVQSLYFKEYENQMNKEIIEKHERTPKGKRVEMDIRPLYNDSLDLRYFYFELPKGKVVKNESIRQNGEEIGRVIRGGFTFTRGKCIGLGYLTKMIEDESKLTVTDLGGNKADVILFIKYI